MKKVKGLVWIVVMGVMLNLTSCLNQDPVEDPYKQLNADIAAIDAFLATSILPIVKDASGVRMEIIELGTKFPAKSVNTTVDVDYVGKLFSNGIIFDQGNIKVPLSSLVNGWKVAFTTLPVGSRAILYIPSSLAYGKTTKPGIPANSILVFQVEFNEAVVTSTELNQLKSDTVAIDNYLNTNAINNVVKDTTGIRYVITQVGAGATPSWYNKLTLKLTYKLLSSPTATVAVVNNVPSDYFYSRAVDYTHGLKTGLQKLSEGSKATFYIPSGLAFGTLGASDGNGNILIPANANIIVDVELTDVADPE